MARQLIVVLALAILSAVIRDGVGNATAQSLTTEAAVTAGVSTAAVAAAATQIRAFGELHGWRFYGDASSVLSRGEESDAFGAAYPYESKLSLLELNVEKTRVSDNHILGARLGRYRTPFGIYSGSDQGYVGFLRAPLMRHSEYWALSNNYLETGASVIAGTTWLSAEVSTGVATDEDEFSRPGGLNTVARVQSARGSWIAGVSVIRTRPSRVRPFAQGRTQFNGADMRWMKGGLQVRGEWIEGRPFEGARTRGAYGDVMVHKSAMGPLTAVARVERLDYLAGSFSKFPRRYTVGARVRFNQEFAAQINYIHPWHDVETYSGHAAVDIALTYSIRAGSLFGRPGH